MKKLAWQCVMAATLWMMVLLAGACVAQEQPASKIGHVSLNEAERFLGHPGTYFFDVNVPEVWRKHHIKGSIHVTDANLRRYLPQDKHAILIFYCAEPRCSGSEEAAESALKLGYSRVYVMPEGIFGWVDAGKPVESGVPHRGK